MEKKNIPIPDSSLAPWRVSESNFPTEGTDSEKLSFLVRYAVLAPSSRNSQPWLFRIAEDRLTLEIDRSRALPVADPDDRALVMSCGAALFHLRVALRRFGYAGEIDPMAPPMSLDPLGLRTVPDRLADVRLGRPIVPTALDKRLFHAIQDRRTNRRPFKSRSVPTGLLADLREVAAAEA